MFSLNSIGKGNLTDKRRVQYLSHTGTVWFPEGIKRNSNVIYYTNTHNQRHLVRDLLNAEFCTLHFKLSIYRNTVFPLSITLSGFIYHWGNKTTNGMYLPQLLGYVWIITPLISFFTKVHTFEANQSFVECLTPSKIKKILKHEWHRKRW